MPPYEGVSQVVEIANGLEDNEEDWGAQYQAHVEEKEKEFFESNKPKRIV